MWRAEQGKQRAGEVDEDVPAVSVRLEGVGAFEEHEFTRPGRSMFAILLDHM